ncbi:hypothetical protein BJ546DRAFT_328311 [Cryomyces antarcticus]
MRQAAFLSGTPPRGSTVMSLRLSDCSRTQGNLGRAVPGKPEPRRAAGAQIPLFGDEVGRMLEFELLFVSTPTAVGTFLGETGLKSWKKKESGLEHLLAAHHPGSAALVPYRIFHPRRPRQRVFTWHAQGRQSPWESQLLHTPVLEYGFLCNQSLRGVELSGLWAHRLVPGRQGVKHLPSILSACPRVLKGDKTSKCERCYYFLLLSLSS